MSLTGITNIALSGINTAQSGLRTTANNISNVNTDGYSRREQIQEAQLVAGAGAGVTVAETRRVVDDFLAKQLLVANADAARFDAMQTTYSRLESALGAPSANSSLTGRLDQLFQGLGSLAIEPDSTIRRSSSLSDLQAW